MSIIPVVPTPPQSITALLGPSVIFVALSLNGGELLLWPDLVANHGLGILWPVPVILLLQYFVNMEISRYTAATGKNTLAGLIQINRLVAFLFPISIVVSLVWPAWASPAGNMIAYMTGMPRNGALFAIVIMLLLTLIWKSKHSYIILENLTKIGLIIVTGIVGLIVALNWHIGLVSDIGGVIAQIGYIPHDVDKFTFVSALAFGGVVGVLNLVQSDWVAKKNYALSTFNPKNTQDINWENPTNILRWKKWYKLMLQEHAILFYAGNIVGIFLLALLAHILLRDSNISGFGLLIQQYNLLAQINPWLSFGFGLSVSMLFIMAQGTILDAQGRLLKHCLPTRLTSNTLSQLIALLGIFILAITYINPNFNQPHILLQTSAILSAAVMALYAPLLLVLNHRLPKPLRPNILSTCMVIACSLLYGIVVFWILIS